MKIGLPIISQKQDRHQLSARVSIDAAGIQCPDSIWFATHGGESMFKAERADPFLLGLIAVAMKLGEPIWVEAPVSARLAFGLQTYQTVLSTWWPKTFNQVEIHYEALDTRLDELRPKGVGCCFSGGLDSFFAVTEMLPTNLNNQAFNITHGLMINGFDQLVDLEHQGMAQKMLAIYQPILASWGIELLMLDTNVKSFRGAVLSRQESVRSFSSSLCASGHALSDVFGRFGIPSHAAYSYEELVPGGTHAAVDHQLGSDQLEVIFAGTSTSRAGKLEKLVNDPFVQKHLRVCFHPPKFDPQTGNVLNCCECEKCVRTIATLLILDKLDAFESFSEHRPVSDYQRPEILATMHGFFLKDMARLAIKHGRKNWSQVLERAWQIHRAAKSKPKQ